MQEGEIAAEPAATAREPRALPVGEGRVPPRPYYYGEKPAISTMIFTTDATG